MQNLYNWLIFLLVLIVIFEFLYIILLRKGISQIARGFDDKLNKDTNTTLTLSLPDTRLKQLALMINKQLKALRKERLKLKRGDIELKNAISNVSHDLRTPLAAIKGYLELLETAKEDNRKKYLAIVEERVEILS